jgi:signal transduction histidine kinase/ActR/RegA family two-component response regulator
MSFEIFFTVGSLVFLVVLIMTYYSKEMLNNTKSKFFRMMLITLLIFCVSEILEIILAKNLDIEILLKIVWRIHCSLGFLWMGLFFQYSNVLLENIKNSTVKEAILSSTKTKVYAIICVVGVLCMLFLPYLGTQDMIVVDDMKFFEGFLMYATTIYGVFMVGSVSLITFTKKDSGDLTSFKRLLFYMATITVILLIIEIIYKNISLFPILFTIVTYLLYFLVENPDLAIIEEINDAQGNIEKSSQTKTDFLSNMTYEIKTPMNLIMGLCDELSNMPTFDEAEAREDIKQIAESGNNLLDIINNILDISKIETGQETLLEKDYNINDIITNIINITKSKIGSKPVKLIVNIDQGTSSVLNGDSSKLYQALLNIAANAARYTDVGRVTITLTSSKSNGIEHLLFKITDTGTGIKEEDKPKIFSKGSRLENATEAEVEGSGLGLAITKQYVEALGGKVWFESQFRVGSTFYVEVPQKIIDATPIGNTVAQAATQTTEEKLDCSSFKVLIVDDNALNIKVAKRLLEKYKFQVESVTSGKDCVYKIKEDEHYDAIFMDHMMPEMDGIETLHVLKKLDGYTLPPIIALTANAIAGMKEMYLNEGFDDYLSKPINTHELDRIVNKFFKK